MPSEPAPVLTTVEWTIDFDCSIRVAITKEAVHTKALITGLRRYIIITRKRGINYT
jgi:hypothetical protein